MKITREISTPESLSAFGRKSADPSRPVEAAAPIRCQICDWPMADSRSNGCVPGNCSYRPYEGTDDWHRIERRKRELAAIPAPPADTAPPQNGVSLIAAERQRQISAERWSATHDDKHDVGEMADAAACYAIFPRTDVPWPWDKVWDKRRKHGPIRRLVVAGALIAAEIDRLNRSFQPPADTREPAEPRCAVCKDSGVTSTGYPDYEATDCEACKVTSKLAGPQCKTCNDTELVNGETCPDCLAYDGIPTVKEPLSVQTGPQEPPRTWLLWFDDKDCVDEVFTDYEVARRRYEACSASWSCTLFASVVGKPAEPVREWLVAWSHLPNWGGSSSRVSVQFQSEQEADDCISGKLDCGPRATRESVDIHKQWRYAAGPWQDADTSAEPSK